MIGSIVPLGAAACFLPFTILCAVPGVVLARRLYRHSTTNWLFALLIGGTWGLCLQQPHAVGAVGDGRAPADLWPCVFRNGSVSIYQRARNR
jgi:hypothetical protein